MKCPCCQKDHDMEVTMELVESTVDFNNPGSFYGHGQHTVHYWECPDCLELLLTSTEDLEAEQEVEVKEDLLLSFNLLNAYVK